MSCRLRRRLQSRLRNRLLAKLLSKIWSRLFRKTLSTMLANCPYDHMERDVQTSVESVSRPGIQPNLQPERDAPFAMQSEAREEPVASPVDTSRADIVAGDASAVDGLPSPVPLAPGMPPEIPAPIAPELSAQSPSEQAQGYADSSYASAHRTSATCVPAARHTRTFFAFTLGLRTIASRGRAQPQRADRRDCHFPDSRSVGCERAVSPLASPGNWRADRKHGQKRGRRACTKCVRAVAAVFTTICATAVATNFADPRRKLERRLLARHYPQAAQFRPTRLRRPQKLRQYPRLPLPRQHLRRFIRVPLLPMPALTPLLKILPLRRALSANSPATGSPNLLASAGQTEFKQAQKYLNGTGGVAADPAQAAELFWRSLEKGNIGAAIPLADLYLQGKGVSRSCLQARILLTTASNKGNAEATQKLGQLPENCE